MPGGLEPPAARSEPEPRGSGPGDQGLPDGGSADQGAPDLGRPPEDGGGPDLGTPGDQGLADATSPDLAEPDLAPADLASPDQGAADLAADLAPPVEDLGGPEPVVLRLNEVACGDADWVEVVNLSPWAGDIGGWVLSDDPAAPEHRYAVPAGTRIDAAGHWWVPRAAGDAAGFPFGLSCARDTLVLLTPQGVLADLLLLRDPGPGLTLGRLPDGAGPFGVTVPTPGEPNRAPLPGRPVLNEVDCHGRDRIELANPAASPALLTGWILTDAPASPERDYVFPEGTVLAPGGHLLVAQQTQQEAGFSFGLDCEGDELHLLRPDRSPADHVRISEHPAATTWGRLPDGEGSFGPTAPTLGEPNRPPDAGPSPLFDPGVLRRVELEASPEALDGLRASPYDYVPARVRVLLQPEDQAEWLEVGLRLKGRAGSLRTLDRKPGFKVDLNWSVPGQEVFGAKKLTLNNMVQDRSMLHEWLAYTILRALGLPAPRLGYAWVTLNGQDYGLYAQIETMDDRLLDRHFPSTAHLYEGGYGTDLFAGHLGRFEVDEGDAQDRADLQALIDAVEGVPEGEFYAATQDLIRWPEVLAQMAGEIYIGHWDGYAPTRNNYYIHFDQRGRASLAPWGTDQTFSNMLDLHGGNGRLMQRCMAEQACTLAFDQTLGRLLEVIDPLQLPEAVAAQAALLRPWVEADPRREYNLGAVDSAVQGTINFLNNRRAQVGEEIACLLGPEADPDGDGFRCSQDCDNHDPAVHPGAQDLCGDRIDQDCNGAVDDGIGCPDCSEVERAGERYLICATPRTFAESEAHCAAQDARLVIIDDADENLWLFQQARATRQQNYWIGLDDRATEGQFLWSDGSVPGFTAWNGGEPNNAGNNEDCAHFWSDRATWNDIPCTNRQGAICERICPLERDEDGDGFSPCVDDCDDGDPAVHPGADEICDDGIDQDCSGLADDGAHCDCLAVDLAGQGYALCRAGRTWEEAQALCAARGLGLVLLDRAAEEEALGDLVRLLGLDGVWLGLNDRAEEGVFVWEDGSPLQQATWAPGEPDDRGGEDCVLLNDASLWEDLPCELLAATVCE